MEILITSLQTCLNNSKGIKKIEADEWELFSLFYNEWKCNKADINNLTFKTIPKFYHVIPDDIDSFPSKLREEGRSLFLQRRTTFLLDNNELRTLWALLDKYHTPPHNTRKKEHLISYSDLKKVLAHSSAKCKDYFTAKLFAQLQQTDVYNRVSILALFNYAMRKAWVNQTRVGLSWYDATGKGYLRESDLESYILDLIPTLPQLDDLEKTFHSFYVCTVVRKFLFFLDPMRTGNIRIQDILACSFLDDLLVLRDGELSKDVQDVNWFSAPSALRVYGQYLNLNKNQNGMLSKSELAGLGTGTLTSVFLERVFQECLTYEGEMDYKTYLDFVLALENRNEPQSLHYFFRILDIKGKGYLDTFTLNYFFRAIQDQMKQNGQEPVSFQDVKDEIFDMIKPADPCRITLQDIINSGQGGTLVSILIDLNGFWNYENRETRGSEDPLDI